MHLDNILNFLRFVQNSLLFATFRYIDISIKTQISVILLLLQLQKQL